MKFNLSTLRTLGLKILLPMGEQFAKGVEFLSRLRILRGIEVIEIFDVLFLFRKTLLKITRGIFENSLDLSQLAEQNFNL